MYKKFILAFCALLAFTSLHLLSENVDGKTSINWMTDYPQAVQQSKDTAKPLVIFFTGSDWCGWCSKLEEEALSTPEFAAAAGDKFIFVKLDFPLYSFQDPNVKSQNKELQERFNIRSFPTIIVINPRLNRQIGVTGYRPGGGKSFAEHLLQMVSNYSP